MTQEELLWKFAEGACSPEESEMVEKLLSGNAALKTALDLILEVQSNLGSMKAEGPSMRFAQSVMESLPSNLYPPLSAESLISPIWKKIFWGSLALLATLVVVSFNFTDSSGSTLPYAGQVLQHINSAVGQLPSIVVQLFGLTLTALLTLGLVDKFLLSKTREG